MCDRARQSKLRPSFLNSTSFGSSTGNSDIFNYVLVEILENHALVGNAWFGAHRPYTGAFCSLFPCKYTSNMLPVTVFPFANSLSSAIPKMFPSVCRSVHARVSALSAVTEHVSPESKGQYSVIQEQPFDGRCSSCHTQFINVVSSQSRPTCVVLWHSHYSSVADAQSQVGNIAYIGKLLHLPNISAR